MGFSFPGSNLFYLSRDNLDPERYELIGSPEKAWRHICDEYEFDDRYHSTWYVQGMRWRPAYSRSYAYQRKPHGARTEERLKKLVYTGVVVMVNGTHTSPGELFYIDNHGKLVCRDVWLFEHSGAQSIIKEYRQSVSCRDYHRNQGRPRPTQFWGAGYAFTSSALKSAVSEQKPETFQTINSKMAGRLLAAGGVYNQNPQMFAEAARMLGGKTAAGFGQILNEQSAGSLIALSSVLMVGRAGVHPTSIAELEKLKDFLGR